MDTSWIQALAKNSKYYPADNKQIINERLNRSFEFIMGELYEELSMVVNIFNEHSSDRIKLLTVNPQQSPYPEAIVLLMTGTQLKIQKSHNCLEVIASMVQDFRQINHRLHTFVPRADSHGGVNWLMDNKMLMSIDLMVKQLIQDLCLISARRKQGR